jgi:hypothetical protein
MYIPAMLPQLARFSQRFGQYGPPYRFSEEYLDGVQCINILYHPYQRTLHEDFSKQKDFINRFLEPVRFTYVEVDEHAYSWQHFHIIKYKCHVTSESLESLELSEPTESSELSKPTVHSAHHCDALGCDDWYIVLSNESVQLLIKYNPFRKVEFTKDDFIRIHTHFARLFNVMRLSVTSVRSMMTLKEYVTRTPRWCERMRADVDAVDTERFPHTLFSLFPVPRFYHSTYTTRLGQCLVKKVKEQKMQRKHAIVKKVQDDMHMRAIPRILLMVPMGINPYAEYVNRFICDVDVYEMMVQSKEAIPVIHSVFTNANANENIDSESLDPTESQHSFMSYFSQDAENSMFYIVARRTRLEDPELDRLFHTPSQESLCQSMKKVFEMFFFGRNMAAHLDRINQLTVFDSCHVSEETFTALFDVYINVFMSYTDFKELSDTNVIHLAYLAECMGDTPMVYRIIDYFLGFRLEYLYRIWKADIPQIGTDFDMPVCFQRSPDSEMWPPNYGWDEDGRDA